jgi:hypothetical protein
MPIRLTTNQLAHDSKSKRFIGEASEVFNPYPTDVEKSVIEVRSAKTGSVATFCFTDAEFDEEGHFLAWNYKVVTSPRLPGLYGYSLTVLND